MDEKTYDELLELLINASDSKRLAKTNEIIWQAIKFQEKLKQPLTEFEIRIRYIEQSM